MEQREISDITLGLMIVVALFYDIFQMLLELSAIGWLFNWVVSIFAFLTFYFWFKMYGRNFMTPKRALAMGAGIIIELIPLLNDLPGWTVAVIFLVGIEKGVKKAAKILGEGTVANKIIQTVGSKSMPKAPIQNSGTQKATN